MPAQAPQPVADRDPDCASAREISRLQNKSPLDGIYRGIQAVTLPVRTANTCRHGVPAQKLQTLRVKFWPNEGSRRLRQPVLLATRRIPGKRWNGCLDARRVCRDVKFPPTCRSRRQLASGGSWRRWHSVEVLQALKLRRLPCMRYGITAADASASSRVGAVCRQMGGWWPSCPRRQYPITTAAAGAAAQRAAA